MVIDKIIFGGSMEEKHMKEKKIIIGVMCALICIMGVAYAAFATNLVINGTASIESTWSVVFTKIEEVSKTSGVTITEEPTASGTSATFNVDLKSPGDYIEYQITVANQGTLNAVIEEITASETGSDAIKFEISNIKKGDTLAKGDTTNFNVKISYDANITSQPTITNNELTININYVQDLGQVQAGTNPNIVATTLAGAILKNPKQSDANIDFSKTSEETNTNGLYYTNKNTQDGKTVYYFRGAVDNNNVQFGKVDGCVYNGESVVYVDLSTEMMEVNPTKEQCESTYVCDAGTVIKDNYGLNYRYVTGVDASTCTYLGGIPLTEKATYGNNVVDILWKIVRINEDGSIRLIYNGTTSQHSMEATIGDSAFNENEDDNAHVGYMYGQTGATGDNAYNLTHENDNPSTIKGYLDTWYVNNLSSYSSYLADAGFCNDRSVAPVANTWSSFDTALGYAKKYTVYGASGRLANLDSFKPKEGAQPQFKCPNEERDLFTLTTSSKGNKKLTNPIGLITMDEVAYAGGTLGKTNESMYLSGTYFWTMSPFYFSGTDVFVWYVGAGGDAGDGDVEGEGGVRPVVNLRSGVEITGGDGNEERPYTIKVN